MQLEPHDDDCNCPLCLLCLLDSETSWGESGDLLAANDPEDEDDGGAGVAVLPHVPEGEGGSGDGLDSPEEIENILDCLTGMNEKKEIQDILVIINLKKNDEQMLLTTIERNDMIMGCLSVAAHNWHSSQIDSVNWEEADDEDGGDL